LKKLRWELYGDFNTDKDELFHNYRKIINNNIVGLDVFIEEKQLALVDKI